MRVGDRSLALSEGLRAARLLLVNTYGLARAKNEKGLQTLCLQALMIGAQERTRTSTPLSAST